METKLNNKDLYEAPDARVTELDAEGVICASGLNDPADYPSGGNPFTS